MPTTLHENRPSAGIGVVEVQKPMDTWFCAISKVPARPSAGIGVVEVQKLEVFCDVYPARATLCGDRRGRGAKTLHGFLRFLKFPRDPLRGSAWSRCKNSRFFAMFNLLARPSAGIGVVEVQKPMVFFAISAVLAQPSAGIGVVEVQKLEVFCDFCGARATLCGDRRGRGAKTRGFLRLLLFELVLGSCLVVRAPAPGTGGSRVRFLPGPRAGVARCNLHLKATCAEQVAQSNLRRPTCTEQFAQSALPRATCAEQLTQSNLHRATCTEQLAQSNLQGAQFAQSNLQGATCRDQLAGATCAEQLAQSNLHSATCVEQLAQTNLHRPVCAERLAWCCLALASQMLRVGKKNASCSVGPTSLAMFCFRANRGLVSFGLSSFLDLEQFLGA